MATMYTLLRSSKYGRKGIAKTRHGNFSTPAFMSIGTRAAVKTLDVAALHKIGAEIILSNTYHLFARPGLATLKRHKGLRHFMQWKGPILTDSGGYQVFSLSHGRTLSERGVAFNDPQSGKKYFFTPEKVIDIQRVIGSDIMMALDECPPYPSTKAYLEASLARTTRWALRSLARKKQKRILGQKLFAIIQGGVYSDLRERHAKELSAHDFNGFALGGLAVGEPEEKMYSAISAAIPFLPADKPRYLMGVGYPHQIKRAVELGIDMFDCVLPTRNARHGNAFVWKNQKLKGAFYETVQITNARFARDTKALDPQCDCETCATYSRDYLRHLFMIHEPLGPRLLTVHNLRFYQRLMAILQKRI